MTNQTKVLFLDVDGVLGNDVPGADGGIPLRRACLRRLGFVLAETGALVVLTSSWRDDPRRVALLAANGVLDRAHPDWRVGPSVDPADQGSVVFARTKGDLIARWLSEHPEVAEFAVVDDEDIAFPGREGRFVRTAFESGLDAWAARALVDRLGLRPDLARDRALKGGGAVPSEDLELAGGGLEFNEAVARSGWGIVSFNAMLLLGHLLCVRMPDGKKLFPAFQFENPVVLARVKLVKDELATSDDWTVLNFLVRPNDRLRDRAPLEVLASEDWPQVLELAMRAASRD